MRIYDRWIENYIDRIRKSPGSVELYHEAKGYMKALETCGIITSEEYDKVYLKMMSIYYKE